MPPQTPRYLSTTPTAGTPLDEYLSTDPQAGTSSPSAASPPDRSLESLALAGAVAAARQLPAMVDATRTAVTTALASPNAPRIIQRAIGAGVRGASTAVGGAIGGVPGAVAGAAMSEGFTPTQQTIRGWLGRQATNAATTAAETGGDAVANYITAMGGDATNLGPAAVEYATKAGRRILYDLGGRASLVPATDTAAEATTAATTAAAPGTAGPVATILKKAVPYLETAAKLSGAQNVLAWAQLAEPNRRDFGYLGVGPSSAGNTTLQQPAAQLQAVQYLIDTKKLAPMAAARAVTGNNPQLADQLLTLYTQARAAAQK